MLQGISLKKKESERERKTREREKDTETRALVKWDPQLYFQKELLYSELHISQVKDTESAQHSINFIFIKTRTFSVHLFINKGLMLCLALWPVNIS